MANHYSISECADKLSQLTQYNIELLQAINKSFYTKSSYVTTEIDDVKYNIPSFLYLENKINELSSNFENLVNAPTTGQAAFSFDGNTQSILLQGFQNAPNTINLLNEENKNNLRVFDTESRDIFKDFTSPYIFTKLQLGTLPDHITEVDIHKVVIHNTDLRDVIGFGEVSNISYKELYSMMFNYRDGVDYVSYTSRYELPTRTPSSSGIWTIKEISNTVLDTESMVEYIELYMNESLLYNSNNQTISKYLAKGDILISYDDKCKFTVEDVNKTTNYLKLRVLKGYINLSSTSDTSSQDMTTLKLFEDFDSKITNKTIKLPLEEDQYIVVFIAPVNSQVNVRAPWSDGLKINVHDMRYQVASSDSMLYESYYNENIKNIGDVLFDISRFTSATLSNINENTFDYISKFTPNIPTSNFTVTQINKHLFDNTDLDNIRELNKTKDEINNRLLVIQNELTEIESILSTTDFSNLPITTRSVYEDKQSELNIEKNTLTNTLINTSNQINLSANSTLIPTQDAKYSIIGYVDVNEIENTIKSNIDDPAAHIEIIKLNVIYRYKNYNNNVSGAVVVDDIFTYSNWNNLDTQYRAKEAHWNEDKNIISYSLSSPESNTLQFNSINIPICYGEQVDMKIQVQYSMGYPYINTVSNWSELITVDFPDTLVTDKDIEEILNQNLKDTNTLNFKDLMLEDGVTSHVQNYVVDQDQTYFHKPESISSGFYTEDTRRIISLKDKLYEINNTVSNLTTFYNNDLNRNLKVYLDDGNNTINLSPNENNQAFLIPSFVDLNSSAKEDGYATYMVNINLSNAGQYPINLYSMFYGDKKTSINGSAAVNKSKWGDFINDYDGEGVISKDGGSIDVKNLTVGGTLTIQGSQYSVIVDNGMIKLVDRSIGNDPDEESVVYNLYDGDGYQSDITEGSTGEGGGDDGAADLTRKSMIRVLSPDPDADNVNWVEDVDSEGNKSNGKFVSALGNDMYTQYLNQFIYFRSTLPFTTEQILYSNNTDLFKVENPGEDEDKYGVFQICHPYITSVSNIQVESSIPGASYQLNPGDNLIIPICVKLNMKENTSTKDLPVSFSLWMSQFSQPIDYTFNIRCSYNSSATNTANSTSSYTAILS